MNVRVGNNYIKLLSMRKRQHIGKCTHRVGWGGIL